jgi:hypothetical protein
MAVIRALLSCMLLVALIVLPPFSVRAHDKPIQHREITILSDGGLDAHDHGHSHDDLDDRDEHAHRHAHGATDHSHEAGILTFLRSPERMKVPHAMAVASDETKRTKPVWLLERPPRSC